jgi:Flp pilus assembly protein TadB
VNLVVAAGALVGLGVFAVVWTLMPARPRIEAAIARIYGTAPERRDLPIVQLAGQRLVAAAPWLPVPSADLALLEQTPEQWLGSKVLCGAAGLCLVPVVLIVLLASGQRLTVTVPAIASLALGSALFFAPDLVTRVNAGKKRQDFRHVLTSYLDLVALERGAGAAPTEALEAAAQIGGDWAFARIRGALAVARQTGTPPWEGLAALAGQIGIPELGDLAEIAEVAGHEGASILATLAARAESMRAAALAATKAKAGSRSTTMVVPIALLGTGFLLLLIFPVVFRTLGT